MLLAFQFPKPVSVFWEKKNLGLGSGEDIKSQVKPTLRELQESIPMHVDPELQERISRVLGKREPYSTVEQIEWGMFLPALRHILWEHVEQYKGAGKLDFRKINGLGEHQPTLYHYMWEVSIPQDQPQGRKRKKH